MSVFKSLIVFALLFCSISAKSQDDYTSLISAAMRSYNNGNYQLAADYCTKAIPKSAGKAYPYTLRGASYLELKMPKEAMEDLNTSIRLDSKAAWAYEKRGMLYSSQGNTIAALTDLNKAVLLDPKRTDAIFARAGIYLDKGQYDLAITAYTEIMKLNETSYGSYFNRGLCYIAKENYTAAIADFSHVISMNPDEAQAFYKRGYCYLQLKELRNARADYSSAIKINPVNNLYYLSRGDVYYREKNYDNALSDFAEAVKLKGNAEAYWDRGLAYEAKAMTEEAIADYTQAYNLDPAYTKAITQRAGLYLSLKKYDEAIQDYDKLIKADPKIPETYFDRGYAYLLKKEYDRSLRDLTTGSTLDPGGANGHSFFALYYATRENFQEAVNEYTKALAIEPKWSVGYNRRAWSYISLGNYESAETDFQKALQIDADDYDATVGLGMLSYYRGNTDQAIIYLTRAIKINPDLEWAWGSRSNVYSYTGEYEKAISDCLKSISIDPNSPYSYVNFFTNALHTDNLQRIKPYLKTYRDKKLSIEHPTNWKFYDNYLVALLDGVLTENYELALRELEKSEQVYSTTPSINQTVKNERNFGFLDVLYLKGYVLEKLEQYDQAKTAYEQALVVNRNLKDAKDAIARIQSKKTIAVKTDNIPPVIELLSPMPTRSFEIVSDDGNTPVVGQATDESGIKSITINGKAVKVGDGGVFRDMQALNPGANVLTVEAIDKNNNKATQTFTLNIGSRSAKNETKELDIDPLIKTTKPRYFALLIANEEYLDDKIPSLRYPVSDAMELKNILTTQYTFKPEDVEILKNVKRLDLYEAVWKKCKSMKENDNLIIFYAGHGWAVADGPGHKIPFLIPVDAESSRDGTYLSAYEVNSAARNSQAKNILLIYDACYLGEATRGLDLDAPVGIREAYNLSSRKIMTSGNDTRVPDKSVFLKNMKEFLKNNKDKYLMASDLFASVKRSVVLSNNPDETEATQPQYAPIPTSGDKGGEFIFIRKTE